MAKWIAAQVCPERADATVTMAACRPVPPLRGRRLLRSRHAENGAWQTVTALHGAPFW